MATTRSEVRKITPQQAQAFINDHPFRLQRKVRPSNMRSLVGAMHAGEFPPGTAIYFATTPDLTYLIDGQHRLRSQINAGIDVEYTITTIECADEQAVSCLYTQFDIGAKRSMGDRMRALDVGDHIKLPSKYAQLIFNGAPHLKYRFRKIHAQQVAQMAPLQRLEILREYESGARQFFEVMGTADKWIQKVFFKPYYAALGAYLFQHSPEEARYLWEAMATNNTGGPDDPRYHMFALAQNTEATTGTAVGIRRSSVTVQAFIRGWNLMVERKSLSTKLMVAPLPADTVHIEGITDAELEPAPVEADDRTQTEIISSLMTQLSIALPKQGAKERGKNASR